MGTIEDALRLGFQQQRAGQLQAAEQTYRRLLQQNPDQADAVHLLGVVMRQLGQPAAAMDLIGRAIVLRPDWPQAINNFGNAARDAGKIEIAIESFRQAIRLKPGYFDAVTNLGFALVSQKRFDEAIDLLEEATRLNSQSPDGFANLANALMSAGQFASAAAAYRKAILIKADHSGAHIGLANGLRESGDFTGAAASYRTAIKLHPQSAALQINLGSVLMELGQLEEATTAFRESIRLNPNLAVAHGNLAIALKEGGDLDGAVIASRSAIALDPNFADAYSNLGHSLLLAGQLTEAMAANRKAISLEPGNAGFHSNLIFALNYLPETEASSVAAELSQWNRRHALPLQRSNQIFLNEPNSERRLRIGYVSADFRQHAVARFLLPLLTNHDRSQFEIYAYAEVAAPDAMTGRLRSQVDVWRSTVGLADGELADQIRADRIDVLVDLALHTTPNRLPVFARKPAPLQITWLGYPGSTGLTAMDYRLSDPFLDPIGMAETIYSEKTIRLPETYWCYQSSDAAPEVGPLPAIQTGHVTFGCLGNFSKVSDAVLNSWGRILLQIPASRLLVHVPQGSARHRVLNHFAAVGISPQRVEFSASVSEAEYFRLYHRIDIALDTFPFAGGTTTLDALRMGVPVVTLKGKSVVGRGGFSILSNCGMQDLVADSDEQYVGLATQLAGDLDRIAKIRCALRDKIGGSQLMDARKFSKDIEHIYFALWQKWCDGKKSSFEQAK